MVFSVDRVHHITLRVSDLERSRHFYEEVLGLQLDQTLPGKYRKTHRSSKHRVHSQVI